jgi:DNA (cytosine-5)-methyltransferase 1
MNVIDLFAGVGGFSTGLKQAGFDIILANEIDSQIAYSYKQNHLDTLVVNEDISKLIENYSEIINTNILTQKLNAKSINNKLSKIDLIVGGPPCQGFSMAGGRIRKSNEFIEDPRNYLFKQYFKIIQKFEPKYFIFENVAGILSMNNGEIIDEIEQLFTNKNNFVNGKYYVQKKVFCANDFGIPQKRKRLILIGSKTPFNLDEKIELTLSKISIEKQQLFKNKTNIHDAIADLKFTDEAHYTSKQNYKIKHTSAYQKYLRGAEKYIFNHLIPNHSEIVIDRIKRIKAGQNWTNLIEKDKIKSIHSGAYGRLGWNELSATITTRFDTPSAGRFIHPELNRNITPREAARIQSFPDDFVFHGNKTSICKQIGNAVPPLLAEFLGNLILNIK